LVCSSSAKVGENILWIYANALVRTKGHAHILGHSNEHGYSLKECLTQK